MEIYTQIDMDYFHLNNNSNNISILGIIGNTRQNTFSFNTISNETNRHKRFINCKKIQVLNLYKILNKDLKTELKKINKEINSSPRNTLNPPKNKTIPKQGKTSLSNYDINNINKLLENPLKISRGTNGKKSIKITKDNVIIENGIKIDFNLLNTNKKIADYINKTYV